jgi:hypothetical protein
MGRRTLPSPSPANSAAAALRSFMPADYAVAAVINSSEHFSGRDRAAGLA